jgi:hypothetical protein
MRVTNFKRIAKEDFEPEMQDTIEKLASSINSFADQVIQAFNGNIGFDNLTQEVVQFNVETDATGKLKTQTEVKSNLRRVQGYTVIRVEVQGAGGMPTAVPLISFTQTETSVRIQSVMGILPNVKYRITAIAIG